MLSESELRGMLETEMRMAGQDFDILRGETSTTVKGVTNEEKGTNRKYASFYLGTDVKEGDFLIQKVTGAKWKVEEVEINVVAGKPYALKAFYQTSAKKTSVEPKEVIYNFHNSTNIIAGEQHHAEMNINIGAISDQIERQGGKDKEALAEMVRELQKNIENPELIKKGSLSSFSALMEKHSWITSSIVQFLGGAMMKTLFGL